MLRALEFLLELDGFSLAWRRECMVNHTGIIG